MLPVPYVSSNPWKGDVDRACRDERPDPRVNDCRRSAICQPGRRRLEYRDPHLLLPFAMQPGDSRLADRIICFLTIRSIICAVRYILHPTSTAAFS